MKIKFKSDLFDGLYKITAYGYDRNVNKVKVLRNGEEFTTFFSEGEELQEEITTRPFTIQDLLDGKLTDEEMEAAKAAFHFKALKGGPELCLQARDICIIDVLPAHLKTFKIFGLPKGDDMDLHEALNGEPWTRFDNLR